jgi:hypothetical protein
MSELTTDTQQQEITQNKAKPSAKVIFLWVFSFIFLLAGIGNLFIKPLAGILEILTGLTILPLFWKIIKNQWGYELNRNYKIALVIVMLLISGSAYGASTPQSNTSNSTAKTVAENTIAPTSPPTFTPEPTKPLSPTPTKIPTPTDTPVPTDVNGFPMDAEAVTVAQIAKVPSAYDGKKLTFTCDVTSFPKNDSGDAAGINCSDPYDSGSLIQVSGSLFDLTKINQGDTVKIYGLGAGASTGKNAFGADVTEAVVSGLFINDITTGYKN